MVVEILIYPGERVIHLLLVKRISARADGRGMCEE